MATHRARGAALPRLALLMSLLAAAHARSSGPASCDARSGHGAADVGDGGYALVSDASVDVTSVAPNTRLELVLVAPAGSAFKGFVMHASNEGRFAVADALVSQLVGSCYDGNAVGHRSASSKSEIRAFFTAPATGGAVTVTAQAVASRMTVYETSLELTVVGSGGEDAEDTEDTEDTEDEDDDDDEENEYYSFSSKLASDVTLRWTIGPADATAVTPAVAASEVAFAIETRRADAASIAVAFQSREGEGAMFPAEAVIAWLAPTTTDDAAPEGVGHVGAYALTSYDAASGVVGPLNPNLEIRDGSIERFHRMNGNVLIARFVARKDDVARATSVADAFADSTAPYGTESVRVAYAVSAVAGKAYHDLGRGVAFVNFVTGDFSRSTARSARLRRDRFFAHGAVALAAWFCFGFGTLASAFFKTVFQNRKRRWFVAHVASQTCGALLAVAALAVALRESAGETGAAFDWARSDASEKKKAHGACGVALVFCVAAQAALGAFREAKDGVREAKDADADGDAKDERAAETTESGLDGSPVVERGEKRQTRAPLAPLRKAHVALGWLLVLGGFANAVVGADLFRRLVARDGAFADAVRGDEQQSSVFSEAAWTGFGILGAGFCLRVVNGARERAT